MVSNMPPSLDSHNISTGLLADAQGMFFPGVSSQLLIVSFERYVLLLLLNLLTRDNIYSSKVTNAAPMK